MKKSVIVLIHLGFWFLYSLLLLIVFSLAIKSNGDISTERIQSILFSILIVPSISVFYFFYFKLFSSYEKNRKILNALVLGFLFSISASAIGVLTLSVLIGQKFSSIHWGAVFIPELLFTFFISTIVGLIGFIIRAFISWFNQLKMREELIEKNHQMELELVKSQLDPHFLFNTLNNIDTLILKEPNKASLFLNKLSDILRFMLFETKGDKIELSKEVDYINKYIELQRVRSINPKYILFEIEGTIENIQIAPMVMIPFIENALKHVEDNTIDDAIKIKLSVSNKSIHFKCENNSSNEVKNEPGIGNKLMEKRLELIYPEKHKLSIKNKDRNYCVNLILD